MKNVVLIAMCMTLFGCAKKSVETTPVDTDEDVDTELDTDSDGEETETETETE
jgi:hypothetical protein